MRIHPTATVLAAAAAALLVAIGPAGCAAAPAPSSDPTAIILDRKSNVSARLDAVDAAWSAVADGRADRAATREILKTLLWQPAHPSALRARAALRLLDDDTPDGQADTRKVFRLRLPTETDWDLIRLMGDAAAARGWTDLTPALVRSFARPVRSPPDDQRPERAALERLHPDRPLIDTVFAVFAAAPPDDRAAAAGPPPGALPGIDLDERTRRDAWALLGRLDPDGARRAALLAADGPSAPADPVLADLRAAAADLRVVPLTAAEFDWVRALRDPADPRNAEWWAQARSAVASLSDSQRAGLALRHIEPIRWAAANRPDWLAADRDSLLALLAARLKGRRTFERTAETGADMGRPSGRLAEAAPRLAWADALTVLVIDEALADASLVATIFKDAEADRADTSTEYGGLIDAAPTGAGEALVPRFAATLYPPRPVQRIADNRFIASDEMIARGSRSLAFYHYHVQRASNAAYAGPGDGDLEFAASQGRACLVFTSIDRDTLNADYYHRGGVIVDLGTIPRRP
jgi:hypothetical protein